MSEGNGLAGRRIPAIGPVRKDRSFPLGEAAHANFLRPNFGGAARASDVATFSCEMFKPSAAIVLGVR